MHTIARPMLTMDYQENKNGYPTDILEYISGSSPNSVDLFFFSGGGILGRAPVFMERSSAVRAPVSVPGLQFSFGMSVFNELGASLTVSNPICVPERIECMSLQAWLCSHLCSHVAMLP
jgi:hypothetical protein